VHPQSVQRCNVIKHRSFEHCSGHCRVERSVEKTVGANHQNIVKMRVQMNVSKNILDFENP